MEHIVGTEEVKLTGEQMKSLMDAIAKVAKDTLQFDLVTELTPEQENRLSDWLRKIGGWRIGNRIGIPTKLVLGVFWG